MVIREIVKTFDGKPKKQRGERYHFWLVSKGCRVRSPSFHAVHKTDVVVRPSRSSAVMASLVMSEKESLDRLYSCTRSNLRLQDKTWGQAAAHICRCSIPATAAEAKRARFCLEYRPCELQQQPADQQRRQNRWKQVQHAAVLATSNGMMVICFRAVSRRRACYGNRSPPCA